MLRDLRMTGGRSVGFSRHYGAGRGYCPLLTSVEPPEMRSSWRPLVLFLELVGLCNLCRCEWADLDVSKRARRFPGGEPQRLIAASLDPGAHAPALMIDVDQLLVVDPAPDHLVGDSYAKSIPGLFLVAERMGR